MGNGSPSLTVVLPVYNGGTTLALAVRSVLAQTFEDYELLVLDDGSTDNSVEVASAFSDPRVHVLVEGTNRGLVHRLNEGVDLARGRYIARMDQDDICFPERFRRQFDFLESHPRVDLVACRAVIFKNDDEITGLIPFQGRHEEICGRPWRGIYMTHPSWMGRTRWFRHHHYRVPEVVLSEDQELLLRSYPESVFACLDDVLLAYRRGPMRLRKVLKARRALLGVQIGHFIRRRQWSNLLLAIMLSSLKTTFDSISSAPLIGRFIRRPKGERVPDTVVTRFNELLRSYGGMSPDGRVHGAPKSVKQ